MFSPLQKYILKECYAKGGKVNRKSFTDFYAKESSVKLSLRTKIISKSLERLIDRGLMQGYGVRTSKKWFISQVKLTALGKKEWQIWLNRHQTKLPL